MRVSGLLALHETLVESCGTPRHVFINGGTITTIDSGDDIVLTVLPDGRTSRVSALFDNISDERWAMYAR